MLEQPAIRAEKIYNYTRLVEDKKGSSDPEKAAKKAKHEFYKAVAAAPTIFWCPNGKQEELIETFGFNPWFNG